MADTRKMSAKELAAEIERLQGELRERQTAERGEFIEHVKARLAELDMPVDDLMAALREGQTPRKGRKGAPLPVKFRGPDGQTWSGRGVRPKWLVEAEAAGRSRAEFAV